MIKLRDIVADYKLRSGSMNDLLLNQLAVSGLSELHLMGMSSCAVKVAYLPVSDMGTVSMPDDYVSYTKVGVMYCDNLWTLTVCDDILAQKDNDGCTTVAERSANASKSKSKYTGGYYYGSHFNAQGENVGQLYSLGGGFNSQGYFKEDKTNRRFLLNGVSTDELILEYISDGISLDSVVPLYAKEALITWFDYQINLRKPRVSMSLKATFGRQWSAQIDRVRNLEDPFRIEEYIDSYYENVHLGVKR